MATRAADSIAKTKRGPGLSPAELTLQVCIRPVARHNKHSLYGDRGKHALPNVEMVVDGLLAARLGPYRS